MNHFVKLVFFLIGWNGGFLVFNVAEEPQEKIIALLVVMSAYFVALFVTWKVQRRNTSA